MRMENSEILRKKLEQFISRYYTNQLIKGLIYGIGLGAMYFLALALAEYFGRFPGNIRFVLLIGLVTGLALIAAYYIIYPLLKLVKLGPRMSYERAARLIGKFFPEIDDKIVNTLQLQNLSDEKSDLIRAGIDQRIASLSPVPFGRAINFGENKKYWPIAVIPLLIFVGILVSGQWEGISESSRRLAAYDREFIPPAPFEFVLLNEDLTAEQGKEYNIRMKIMGQKIPMEAELEIGDQLLRMQRGDSAIFSFRIPQVLGSQQMRFKAAGYYSGYYTLNSVAVPKLQATTISVFPPAYTGIKPYEEEVKMIQQVPEGSQVEWVIQGEHTDSVYFVSGSDYHAFAKKNSRKFIFRKKALKDIIYGIRLSREGRVKEALSGNQLKLIKDQHPQIEVRIIEDSLQAGVLYYSGTSHDDYGFSSLTLHIKGREIDIKKPMNVSSGLIHEFRGSLILDSLVGDRSVEMRVYFNVSDNDGVNGPKTSSSQSYTFKVEGKNERREKLQKGYQDYLESSKDIRESQKNLEEALNELKKQLLARKSLSFNDKTKVQELLNKQKELLEKQNENRELLEKLKQEDEKVRKTEEELKKEEEKIEGIKAQDKEIQELLKEIEKLMEKLDTESLKEKLDELEHKGARQQQAEKRREDLLKDLLLKKDILESAEKLENLAKKMEELSEQNMDSEKERKEQAEVKKEFEKLEEKLSEMKENNQGFKEASESQKMDEKSEEAGEQMQKSDSNLDKNQGEKANENQKKASEKMKEMSQSLQMSMMDMQMKANRENMETLRQILENLETVSFGIEDLAEKSRKIQKEDPSYRKLLSTQKKLRDGTILIEDSLTALAERVPDIKQIVFEELDNMKFNMTKSQDLLQEMESERASSHQQFVMTAANNLALLLDESLRNMQQMQAQMKMGQQQCQKPGSRPDGKTLKEMQSQVGKMMDRMKQGNKKGENGKMSKEMVETISKQEQIRRALEQMQKEEGGQGSNGDRQKAIEEMKNIEKDLMKGSIPDNYKERIQEIETRLLESEKAELKQKQDERREAKSADQLQQLYNEELDRYLRDKEDEIESIRRLPLEYKSYYKKQANQYFLKQ